MVGRDGELELLRNGANCAALLERLPSPPWRLDSKESTRQALKYSRGEGEVVIVNHNGRGWWDTQSSAKGDIFDLVRFLDPGLTFGQVKQVLCDFVGVAPTCSAAPWDEKRGVPERPLPDRWKARPRLRAGSRAWSYLTVVRHLPPTVLLAAKAADCVREGAYGSPWFAHRDETGRVSHIEIRGADFKGSVRGGRKTLFCLPGAPGALPRLAIAEAPIDALSLAALEGLRADTLYAATGGGMGPGTEEAIARALAAVAASPGALLVSGTDANVAGDRYARRHAEIALAAGVAFQRLRPAEGADWNEVLCPRRGAR